MIVAGYLLGLAFAAATPEPGAAAGAQEPYQPPGSWQVELSVSGDPAVSLPWLSAVRTELARTPRRHALAVEGESKAARSLVHLAVEFDDAIEQPRLHLVRSGARLTPGWLTHALLRGAEAVDGRLEVASGSLSWVAQLVERSTTRVESGPAERALERGVPSVRLVLASEQSEGSTRLVAAMVRRLDGLVDLPLPEQEYLVAGHRVWLRRDLYWLGLVLWVGLYVSGRRAARQFGGGDRREFRWAVLGAWLLSPVFAAVLLAVPIVVMATRPRWWRTAGWIACVPTVLYLVALIAAFVAGRRPVFDVVPMVLVSGALLFFGWLQLGTQGPRAPTAPVDATASRDVT